MVGHPVGATLEILNSFKFPPFIHSIEKKKSWKFESLISFLENYGIFSDILRDFSSKIEFSWRFDHQFWLMYSIRCSQFLQMLSRIGWLYGKVNCKMFEKSIKKIIGCWKWSKMHFFEILNEIAFLNHNLRKRQKEKLQTFFPVILNGPLS